MEKSCHSEKQRGAGTSASLKQGTTLWEHPVEWNGATVLPSQALDEDHRKQDHVRLVATSVCRCNTSHLGAEHCTWTQSKLHKSRTEWNRFSKNGYGLKKLRCPNGERLCHPIFMRNFRSLMKPDGGKKEVWWTDDNIPAAWMEAEWD
jgi:hypothetical protein